MHKSCASVVQKPEHLIIHHATLSILKTPLLAPPEGLRAPELPGVNTGDRPKESGGDSKAISAKKIYDFTAGRRPYGWTDRRVGQNSDVDRLFYITR